MNIKLSIIIPVYNVEQYLQKCLNSCVNQDADKQYYEIIIVNDGSLDNCGKILEQYNWKGCQHTVLTQKNQGLSAARNSGIKVAKGEYLWFVDSDDWLEQNSVSLILPLLTGVEVVYQSALYFNYADKVEIKEYSGHYTKGRDITLKEYNKMAQMYIYRRDFFSRFDLQFKVGVYHEDVQFTPRALYFATTASCLNTPIYHYLQREGSISYTINPKRIADSIDIYKELYTFSNTVVKSAERDIWRSHVLVGILYNILWMSKQDKEGLITNTVKDFVNDKCYHCIDVYAKSTSIKERSLAFFAKCLMGNLYIAYSFLHKIRY